MGSFRLLCWVRRKGADPAAVAGAAGWQPAVGAQRCGSWGAAPQRACEALCELLPLLKSERKGS